MPRVTRLLAATRLTWHNYVPTGTRRWSPAQLFAADEAGAWYDPSDLSTLFQDRTGSTPVTADGQTVGLMLDKSKGLVLGSELVTNGDFSTDSTTGWISGPTNAGGETFVASGGVATVTPTSFSYSSFRYPVTCVIGKTYELRASWNTNGALLFDTTGNGSTIVLGSGPTNAVARVVATATTMYITLVAYATLAPVQFDNVSVKEIPGNHAVAPSDAARPLYKTDGTYHWLQFDGVDDSLVTGAIDFTATQRLLAVVGIDANAITATPFILGSNWNTSGGMELMIESGTTLTLTFGDGVDNCGVRCTLASPLAKSVWSMYTDKAVGVMPGAVQFRSNYSDITESSTGGTLDTTHFGNLPFRIGGRAASTQLLTGNLYSVIVRGALSTTQEITDTETWVNGKTGAY